eukprot:gb/GFBE01041686.1/.p1 GENE.gb/GFBE01041686.1/~~gb/GFBE01041686.1/.p1  ORF type:complete len:1063 (+),score=300.14 gb/GFBE01041686.1/:1-3189(+)
MATSTALVRALRLHVQVARARSLVAPAERQLGRPLRLQDASAPLSVGGQSRGFFFRSGDGDSNNSGNSRGSSDDASGAASGDGAAENGQGRQDGPRMRLARSSRSSGGRASSSTNPCAAEDAAAAPAENGASAEDGAIVPVTSSEGGLRKESGGFEPYVMAMPLPRRPLFPGQQQLLQVTHPKVIKELMSLMEKGQPPFIGAFLHKDAAAAEEEAASESREKPLQLEDLSKSEPLDVLYTVGTRARILQAMPFTQHGKYGQISGMQMLLHGHDLVRLDKILDKGPPLQVQVSRARYSTEQDQDNLKAYINETMHTIREIMKINPQFREHASMIHQGLERLERGDPHAIAHFAASLTTAAGSELMEVLESDLPSEKLRLALVLLKKELELSQLQQKIATQIEEKVSKHQREFMLREQLKMIKKELGIDKDDGSDTLLQKFRERLDAKTVPKEVKDAIDSEMEKFSNLAKESQEYQMTRNYLDWLTTMPWGIYSKDTFNLKKAREILDRDHYGLPDIKDRIRELIAVGVLRGTMQGKILCFVGPPGVGKTSIGKSIAEALGREFYRFSVGGLYDVAEIKGHRRTYVGAMPGKIIQCLKKTQTANPLVLIDEVDKIGRGHQGDPSSALLELLDPSQNSGFLDHYLDVPVDCSRVLFVCTANVTDTIPGPLLDRMEVIRLSGYDLQEKLRIAEDYLVPNALKEVGLHPVKPGKADVPAEAKSEPEAEPDSGAVQELALEDAKKGEEPAPPSMPPVKADIDGTALEALIRWYCREAGVRNLQKHVERICRKLATKVVEQREAEDCKAADEADDAAGSASAKELIVTENDLSDYVGKPPFTSDRLYEGQLPAGTVTGLAWTSMGGAVLYVEATAIPRWRARQGGGSGDDAAGGGSVGGGVPPSLSVTGQLGSVMKESSQIALLLARRQLATRAEAAASEGAQPLRASFFEEHELYLHCPEGATPKDGPSAGVTMTTALLSLALRQPARADLAMTGEVSLNGKVLAVGGIKEKTIAARRAGCKCLVFPQANRRDFEELPEYLREGLEVHFAAHYDEVFSIAFPEVTDNK